MRGASILLFATIVGAPAASACSLVTPLIDIELNRRVVHKADGSFKGGGEDDNVRGKPVFDIGNGRIGQVITFHGACQYFEHLLLVDCSSMQMTALYYVPEDLRDSEEVLQGSFPVTSLLPPDGLLGEVEGKNLTSMKKFLVEHGASDANGILQTNSEKAPRDQFNPFFGCKAFYPGSPGASYKWPNA